MILRNASIGEMLSEIGNRKLALFGAGGSMRDFFQDFGEAAAEHVSVIVDNSPGERTEFIYKERRILVLSWEDFEKQVSGDSCAILITVKEFEEVLCQLDKVEALDRSLCYVLHAPFLWNHSRNGRRFVAHDFRRERGKIPKIIHYCWFGPSAMPELERRCVKGWEQLYPDYRFLFWNEKNFDVTKVPYVREAYEAGKYSFVSDYVRLDVLYRYGGIYLDTDVELFERLEPLMGNDAFFAFEHWNLLNTGLGCGCIPLHPVIKDLRSLYHRMCFRNADGSLNLTSCPEYHTEYFQKMGVEIENRTQEVGGILFLSSDYLSPMNQGNGMLELNVNSMGIHKYSCSWLPEEQKRAWEELKAKRAPWNERLEKDWKKWMEMLKICRM